MAHSPLGRHFSPYFLPDQCFKNDAFACRLKRCSSTRSPDVSRISQTVGERKSVWTARDLPPLSCARELERAGTMMICKRHNPGFIQLFNPEKTKRSLLLFA